MERWYGKVALVTGASAGIGEAIAEKLVRAGLKVIGLARRVEKIEKNAQTLSSDKKCKGKLYALKCDMTNEQEIFDAFAWTEKNVGHVHILVNNAGANPGTNLLDGVTERWRQCFDINVIGLLIATREASKIMRKNDIKGHIVNINSVLGHCNYHFPNVNVYPATKHAVTNLTEILRQELMAEKHPHIKMSSVSPGPVETEFFTDDNLPQEAREVLKSIPHLSSEEVADCVVYILSTPPSVHIGEMTVRPPCCPC